jgi:hypothetical protein
MDNKTLAEKQNLKLEILEKIADLVTVGLGLVAALAWNDAIQELFKTIFGTQSTLLAKFLYAAIITVIIVYITIKLGRVINKVKEQIGRNK